mmetsp:Transcript_11295/g.29411  ORF Transcript_11295/g.29411 Transcript_11295/m.29411 type:complete len:525 (+) Transcript_11295:40-1614(+)
MFRRRISTKDKTATRRTHQPRGRQLQLRVVAMPAGGEFRKLADEDHSFHGSPLRMNPNVVKAQYAVRGEIVNRAKIVSQEVAQGKHPFDTVVWCNIGNPQKVGQQPITFIRQLLSLCECPQLLDNPAVTQLFPSDICQRARALIADVPGGTGSYSESPGVPALRRMVAEALQRRDGGCNCDPEDIYLLDGASAGVHLMMRLLLRPAENDAMLVPIPQYPLYSATLALYGGSLVPYYLEEEQAWGLNTEELKAALAEARRKGMCVRALVVINPGNPTGQCLSYENQVDIIKLCAEEDLVLIADEVYQENVYAASKKFTSFKKVATDLGLAYRFPIVSLHSTSKGFIGECGRRGGFMEMTGFPDAARDQIFKLASINLCPNISGQIATSLMMNPPREGEPSYELYMKEKTGILESLKRRARTLVSSLNKLEGVTCNEAEGALYAFPRIRLPARAVEAAAKEGKSPDGFYCMEMLMNTGIVVVPGSGFGQKDGTYHFRTTFLPSENEIGSVIERLSKFHADFLKKYS